MLTIETALLTALLAALVTTTGWLVSHRNASILARRKDHLELVNQQLAEFYGPLHVACESGLAAYRALLKRLGRQHAIFGGANPPTDEELKEWFHWMRNVLMPLNDLRERLILEKSHRIREDRVPSEILGMVAHVVTYRALLARWEQGDFSELYSPIEFPEGLNDYARESFASLKAEQAELIGLLRSRRLEPLSALRRWMKGGIKELAAPNPGPQADA